MEIKIYTDGGSRGNPGISGFGLVIFDEKDNIIHQESKFLGIKTNNEAEYLGLIAALEWLDQNHKKYQITGVSFFSDSQLLVRQLQGKYKVKSPNLIGLYQQSIKILNKLNLPFQFNDIRRHLNTLADELANQAMDRRQ